MAVVTHECPDTETKDTNTKRQPAILNRGSRLYRLAAVFLGLLCVLQLIAITLLWIKRDELKTSYTKLTIEREQLQTGYNNLTIERDQLQTRCNKPTIKRDQLQPSCSNLTIERNLLQANYASLAMERDQLQIHCTNLTIKRDQLQISYNNLNAERDNLQISYNTLTAERDQLQSSYNTLTAERDQLQSSYNTLTAERDQLQSSYNTLTAERGHLQTRYINLVIERDQIQASYNNLSIEKDQLHTSYKNLAAERDHLQTSYTNLTKTDGLQKKLSILDILDSFTKQGWIYFNDSVYYISTVKKSWTESRKNCESIQGHLVIINSKEEQDFVDTLSSFRDADVFIGLTDMDTEGSWKWVDNSALSTGFSNWEEGQPNNGGWAFRQDCAVTRSRRGKKWDDVSCYDAYYWICEKKFSS